MIISLLVTPSEDLQIYNFSVFMTQLTPLFISDDFVSWYLQGMKKNSLIFPKLSVSVGH